jgi:hypothetical protein
VYSLKRSLLVMGALLCPLAAPATAAAQANTRFAPSASEVTVYLLTMGQGDQVWEKFGHDALWIHDPIRGTDQVYNYGVFDFHSPGYWGRFVKGDWIYQIAADDIYQTFGAYQYYNRTLVAQELNLTPEQEEELRSFLEWNLRPENREYRYDYFLDNCSTRIRDAIDRVLEGQLKAATIKVPTETTYRSHSRRLVADDAVIYTALDAGLGPRADRRINAWEEMFLPEKVHDRVAELRVVSPSGGYQPLVRNEHVLYAAVGREPERTAPPRWIPGYLLVGAALGGVMLLLGVRARRSGAARFFFSGLVGLWTLLIGTGGVLLLALWTLTDHQIAYRNENLFQFDPLALALVLLLPAAAYGARWAQRPALLLAAAVAALSLLGFVLQPLPGLDQSNGQIIAMILPVHLALAYVAYRLREQGTGTTDREQGTGHREQREETRPTPG